MSKTIDYYNENSEEFIKGTIDANPEILYKMFEKYLKNNSHILDFGCGSGRDSKYFLSHGYDVTATDGSKEMCEKASKYIGQLVKCQLFEELDDYEKYDAIWACSSVLHVPLNDLPSILEKMKNACKINGIIFLSFKYGNFSGERNGRFFTDLTEEKSFEIINKINGLEILETSVTGDIRKGREEEKWLNIILKKSQ